jgi:hypothetical protein
MIKNTTNSITAASGTSNAGQSLSASRLRARDALIPGRNQKIAKMASAVKRIFSHIVIVCSAFSGIVVAVIKQKTRRPFRFGAFVIIHRKPPIILFNRPLSL